MQSWWEKGKQLWSKLTDNKGDHTGKQSSLNFMQWVLILACLGVALMILANYFSVQESWQEDPIQDGVIEDEDVDVEVKEYEETFGNEKASPSSMKEYEEYLENQLKDILSKIHGVGEATVMINLDSTEEIVVEKDRSRQHSVTQETDREGGDRHVEDQSRDEQVVLIPQGSNSEKPIIVKTKKPEVRGVLVVAPGAEHLQVKEWLIEAVQRVLDVPAHRVSVMPKHP